MARRLEVIVTGGFVPTVSLAVAQERAAESDARGIVERCVYTGRVVREWQAAA
jgi:hypothetical protein